ncbi:hypothetical protein FRC02_000981 [Tulasnella sp. 418]|nr:hypothetical protein FRC02_000981 [Tulasnella sp. 418]
MRIRPLQARQLPISLPVEIRRALRVSRVEELTKRVKDDEIRKENLQDYKASRKEADLHVPFLSLLTRITDLFHEDQAFKKRRKPLFHALRNTVIGDSDESEDATPSQGKPNGVGVLDIGTAGENTSSPDSWRNVVLCMEFKMPTATGSSISGLARDAVQSISHELSSTQSPDLPCALEFFSSEWMQTAAPVGQNLTSENSSINQEDSSMEGKLANWDDARVKILSSDYYWAVPQSDTQVSVHSEGERDESENELSQRMVQLSSYALEMFMH